jgi:hypothetical protein
VFLKSLQILFHRLKQKRQHIEEKTDHYEKIPPLNNWNEFRPPLTMYNIKNKQIDAMSQRAMANPN